MARAVITPPRLFWLLPLAAVVMFAAFWELDSSEEAATADASDDQYRFVAVDCWFEIPESASISCGELQTPASTGAFVLPVVRIHNDTAARRDDGIIYLQGGPGGSARLDDAGIRHWVNWVEYAAFERDFLLMDPRGAGRSQPSLTCKAYDDFSISVLKRDLTFEQELAQGYAVVAQCFRELESTGFDLTHYGSERSRDDLRALINLLAQNATAAEQWNLLGVSYGSRLALLAANDFPLVRSIILDSVYPPGYGGGHDWPALLDRSVRRFSAWCDAAETCSATNAHGQPLLARLELALANLRRAPITFTVRRWNGDAPVEAVINDHRFLSAIFSALYDTDDWQHIPPAIEAAINGERAGLTTLVESFINNALSDYFYGLVFMAVDCQDHPPSSEAEYLQQIENYPLLADYTRALWRYQACHFLATPENPGLILDSLPTQPALLLSGSLDPITPVEWSHDMHGKLTDAQLVVIDNLGHAVINNNACVHRHLRDFLNDPHKPFAQCVAE